MSKETEQKLQSGVMDGTQGLAIPKADIDQAPLSGTSEQDYAAVYAAAVAAAQKELGAKATPEQIGAYVGKFMQGHTRRIVIPQVLEKTLGKGAADAYQLLLKSEPELQKKVGENGIQIFLSGWSQIQQSQALANDTYLKRFGAHQDDIINSAIAAGKRPYEQLASLGGMGVFFGGIAQIVGQLSGKPEWAIAGQSLMTAGFEMGKTAREEIMNLDKVTKMADATRRAPSDWNPAVKFDVSPEMAALAKQLGVTLSPDLLKQHIDRARISIDNSPYPNRADTPRGAYGPVSALDGATRDQVFSAMIMQESGGNKNAVSPKGAMGLGQIMPDTAPLAAKAAGVPWDAKRYAADPAYQLQLSRGWFDRLADKYDNNMVLTLAAYNSGEGAVEDFMNGTNKTRNTRGGPTNPRTTKLGDPRTGETTNTAFAENYPYGETRIYIGKIADRVAKGTGFDVASVTKQNAVEVPSEAVKPVAAKPNEIAKPKADERTSGGRGDGNIQLAAERERLAAAERKSAAENTRVAEDKPHAPEKVPTKATKPAQAAGKAAGKSAAADLDKLDQQDTPLKPVFMASAAANEEAYKGTSTRRVGHDAGVGVVALQQEGQEVKKDKVHVAVNTNPLQHFAYNMG